jgi:curli biogenesis system outer membrane secretion channel CsgG
MKTLVAGITLALAGAMTSGSVLAASDGRPTIGVAEFTNQSGAAWWRGGVGWELSSMLSNELASTGSFHVVERQKLQNVLEEQNLAASGRMAPGQGAKIGKLTGADYLVTGTVSAYEENTSSTGGGFTFKGIGLGGKQSEAYLAIDLRVINTTTGDVDYARTVEGRSKSSGVAVGIFRGGFGGTLAKEENTPAGKAIRAALVEASEYLECVMVKRDSCIQEYNAKEQKRRASDKKALKLD